jgi:hypothetical protein
MIIYESDDLGKAYMKPYLNVIYSTKIRSYLNAKGYPWRVLDDDPPMVGDELKWKAVRDAAKAKLFPDKTNEFKPVVAIVNKTNFQPLLIEELPGGEVETEQLLKKWGGE